MLKIRVIPALLLKERYLVKTKNFSNPSYLGDPINILKIFNQKEVDEVVLLDITATVEQRPPQFELLEQLASECFMPLSYGGGVRNVEDVGRILGLGIEKIVINSYAVENPEFITEVSGIFGSQSIVASIDVKKTKTGGYEVYTHGGKQRTNLDPAIFTQQMEKMGAGEIFLSSIDCDGMMQGYDLAIANEVADAVSVPVIVCGGAGNFAHLEAALKDSKISAAACASLFHFGDNNPIRARSTLRNRGVAMRMLK